MPPRVAITKTSQAFMLVLIPGDTPRRIGIVVGHFLCGLFRIRAEVLLINASLLIHDEGHDAGFTIFGGPRHEREAADHVSVDDVVVSASRGRLALAGENLEEITVERFRSAALRP